MARLDVAKRLPNVRTDVKLRTPVNWTAVLFFAGLASLHLFLAGTAIYHGRSGGNLSLIFGVGFTLVAIACGLIGTELAVQSDERRLRLRTGTRRFYHERFVPFTDIRSVRLTLLHPRRPLDSTIELVCDREVVDCPPTDIPREEALCLATTIGVRLVKVYGDAYGPVSERISKVTSSSPDV